MTASLSLLQVIGKAALPVVTGGASTVVEVGASIASQVWEWWGKKSKEDDRRRELEELAQLTAAELRGAVRDLAAQLAGDRSPAERSRLEGYLLAVPAQVRRTMRRPSDIAGLTVPPDLVLSRMEDLIPLLPPRPPQFTTGDRAPGTDLELVELLGIGGFGEVWKARNTFMRGAPSVALKFCVDATAAKSLRQEAELLDRIQHQGAHPGIVQLRQTYLSAEPPFLQYELVEGGDLGGLILDWHRKRGCPTPDEAAGLIQRLAEIVAFAHERGIIHRDLKPANILVQGSGTGSLQLKIADFGIGEITAEAANRVARLTGLASTRTAAAACGGYSLYYASPEQVRGAKADPRDDVHAIGVIWYQLLVGDMTAEAPRGPGWKKRLAAKGMSAELIELLEACTATDRDDRPPSAGKVAERIGLHRGEVPPAATSSVSSPRLPSQNAPASTQVPTARLNTEALVQVAAGISHQTKRNRFSAGLVCVLEALDRTTAKPRVPTLAIQIICLPINYIVSILPVNILFYTVRLIINYPITVDSHPFLGWSIIIIGLIIAVFMMIKLWKFPAWVRNRKVRRLMQSVDDIIGKLRSEFPAEMAALGNIDLHHPIALRKVINHVDHQLAGR